MKFLANVWCLVALVTTAFVVSSPIFSADGAQARRPPNILFILADDLGWADLGCYGSTFYETPNLDRLAREGTRFTQAYAACPVCSPTRASIYTGKYPVRVGVTDYIEAKGGNQPGQWTRNTRLLPAVYRDRLALEERTVAEALKEAGYATGFFGKWHLGPKGFYPEDQGFDVNKGGCEKGSTKHFPPYNLPNLTDGPKEEYLADRLTEEAMRFIEGNKDKPFLCFISHYDVHTPLASKEPLIEKYRKKGAALGIKDEERWRAEGRHQDRRKQDHAVYGAMMECLDASVGRVLDKLETLGLSERTVVIFFSDNGGLSTSEGAPTSNAPLRAGKGWFFEGGIRDPLIIKWPGVGRKGAVCDTPVGSIDFFPTVLEMAGAGQGASAGKLDGVSLSPLLKGIGAPAPRALFWHYPHYGNQGGSPGAAIRDGDWKLIEFFEGDRAELYNLKKDFREAYDLASKMPDKVKELRERLHGWQKENGAKFPTANPAYKAE